MFKESLHNLSSKFVRWRMDVKSRHRARKHRRGIIKRKGYSVVDRNLKKQIKAYCRSTFGNSSCWPWIAVYAEIRGEYKEGWIPQDQIMTRVFPVINNRNVSAVSMCKTLSYRLFEGWMVKPLVMVINHRFFDGDFRMISMDRAGEILRGHGDEIVIKDDGSGCGEKVVFIHPSEIDLGLLASREDCVIQPSVKQHKILQQLYPGSVNTLRILTYLDETSNVQVLCALLKIGAKGIRVDNTARGGRFVYVDHDGRVFSNAYDGKAMEIERRHPDTGVVYKEVTVPSTREAIELCIKAHYKYPYVAIIGWDVYIDIDGKPGIIEWNAMYPGVWLNEALIGPLFDIRKLKQKMDQANITI